MNNNIGVKGLDKKWTTHNNGYRNEGKEYDSTSRLLSFILEKHEVKF